VRIPRLRIAAPLAPVLVLAALALPLAFAQEPRVEVQDARDASAPLDLREVDSALEANGLRFTLITWSPWRSRVLLDRAYLLLDLDPRTGRRFRILLRSIGRRLVGVLYRKRGGRDRPVRRLTVWRRNRTSVSVRVPARSVGLTAPGQLAWRAQSLVTRSSCPRVCFDRAPDQGDALVNLPPPAPPAPPAG
jgi:hypothetical protein